jgi:hypothetical protein
MIGNSRSCVSGLGYRSRYGLLRRTGGFTIDYDTAFTEEYRVVQLRPPARARS